MEYPHLVIRQSHGWLTSVIPGDKFRPTMSPLPVMLRILDPAVPPAPMADQIAAW